MSRDDDSAPAAPAGRPSPRGPSVGPAGLGREAPPKAEVLGALAARARAAPVDPWLFHRQGWDWRWRSWSQVADQVARGAGVLRRQLPEPDHRVAFDGGQDPDGIAAGLAIQAAGTGAVPFDARGAPEGLARATWARVDGTSQPPGAPAEILVLPAARSPLERTPLEPLELDPAAAAGTLDLPGLGALPTAAVFSAARRLADALPSHRGRPILCATPGVDLLTTQVIQAWTLLSGAAWVLEPLADAFVPTALWARPTVACGSTDELGKLAVHLRERKHRRRHRLRAVALLGQRELAPPASDILRDGGISIVRLTPEAVQSWLGI